MQEEYLGDLRKLEEIERIGISNRWKGTVLEKIKPIVQKGKSELDRQNFNYIQPN